MHGNKLYLYYPHQLDVRPKGVRKLVASYLPEPVATIDVDDTTPIY
jgi:hypothetical protein